MIYEHCVAICKALYYLIIINEKVRVLMLLLAQADGVLLAVVHILFVHNFPFYGSHIIDHFTCDMYP